jgi:hypothetical protein
MEGVVAAVVVVVVEVPAESPLGKVLSSYSSLHERR